MANPIDRLEDLCLEVQDADELPSKTREDWCRQLRRAIREIEDLDEDSGEDDDGDDGEAEGDTYLSHKVRWQVAHTLMRPEWQVEEDPEAAVLDLCTRASLLGGKPR
jgi:hypothetical protein